MICTRRAMQYVLTLGFVFAGGDSLRVSRGCGGKAVDAGPRSWRLSYGFEWGRSWCYSTFAS